MFEKVNPSHPDKIADRIAGALVDYAYTKVPNPRIAVEVLIGHGRCFIIAETSVQIPKLFVLKTVWRITGNNNFFINYNEHTQDGILAKNQFDAVRCGDNGIFKGVPITREESILTKIAKDIYDTYKTDGKYIYDHGEIGVEPKLIICQSNAGEELKENYKSAIVNPLGFWKGGLDVDSGATNRKLGSDMGFAITGGGLHGKDLSKADVSLNIYAHLKAQEIGSPVWFNCAIGDEIIDGKSYAEIVEIAREYINKIGGFEKFAEWGLIR